MKPVDLTETQLTTETVFRGQLLHVKQDTVRLPNGNKTGREYIVHPGAVLIVPLLGDGRLVMERQYRYPLRQTFIEFPAGKIDPNEDPLATGQRELLEESGYIALEWHYLVALHPCIGYSDEIIYIYLATDLQDGKHNRDHDEILEVFTLTLDEAMEAMRRGEITDSKTMIALFWVDKYLKGIWGDTEFGQ